MARVKVDKIVEHLKPEIRHALEDTVKKSFPGVEFSREKLFRDFAHEVRRRLGTWKTVPDSAVEEQY